MLNRMSRFVVTGLLTLAAATAAARDEVIIFPEINQNSSCPQSTAIVLQSRSGRIISVDVRHSNNFDNQSSILSYTVSPSQKLYIGCQYDNGRTNTFSIARAEYR
jgi:hypothetical protein